MGGPYLAEQMQLNHSPMVDPFSMQPQFGRYNMLSAIQKMQQTYIYKQMMYEQEMDNLKQAQITLTENIQRSNLAGLLSSSNEKVDKINLRKT